MVLVAARARLKSTKVFAVGTVASNMSPLKVVCADSPVAVAPIKLNPIANLKAVSGRVTVTVSSVSVTDGGFAPKTAAIQWRKR